MKKAILIITGIVLIVIALAMSFGLQIGNVKIGTQDDTLEITQNYDFESSPFSKQFIESNKLICLNLWASWCNPCIAEMPLLNEIKNEFEEKNVAFISLSVDKDSLKLSNFLNSGKFEFNDITIENLEYRTAILNFLNDKPSDNKINSYTVPVTYLIKDKRIVKTVEGAIGSKQELTAQINSILNE